MKHISIFQFAPKWLDVTNNLDVISEVCQSLSGASDLLILPEMFNSGYVLVADLLSKEWQGETMSALKTMAKLYHISICGSIPFFDHSQWFNRFILVEPTGTIQSYDKIQLFAPAGEKETYHRGNEIKKFSFLGWNIQPLICYDLRFPYLSFRNEAMDMIIYSANWPKTRVHHWKSLLIARAIENQCYVIGVNRTGRDENGFEYPGASMVVDFAGNVLNEMDEKAGFLTIALDQIAMLEFRTKLPFAADRIQEFMVT